MRAEIEVESSIRTITLTLSSAEALELREWLHETKTEPPYAGKLLYGALSAVAENREYGGH